MPPFIKFIPPLDEPIGRFQILDFNLGEDGSDGRNYPGHLRVRWLPLQRNAVVDLTSIVPLHIEEVIKQHKPFHMVTVEQPNRRVTMYEVKITQFTQYLNEPKKLFFHFDRLSILNP